MGPFTSNAAVSMKVYHDIGGVELSELTSLERFPGEFDDYFLLPAFETPSNKADNYGVLVQGYLTPPATGDYTFFICSDDEGALYLSTDETEANKRMIAREPSWNGSRIWTSHERRPNQENVSDPIHLVEGKRYYIEALMKEGGGGDNLAVAWRKPGDPAMQDGDPPIPGEFLSPYLLPSAVADPPAPPDGVELELLLLSRLTWFPDLSPQLMGYLVERSADLGPWDVIGYTNDTLFSDPEVVPGRSYRYRVSSVNRFGEKGPSSDATDSASVGMVIRQMEDYNYGGGQYPGFEGCPIAIEAPSRDSLDPGYDYFYQHASSENPPNQYRSDPMVVVDENPNPSVTQNIIAYTNTGDWWRYTFDVPTSGWIRFSIKAATPNLANIGLYWDGEWVGDVTCHTGSWGHYDQFHLEEPFRSEAGVHTLRIVMSDSAANLDLFGIEFGGQPPSRRQIYMENFEGFENTEDLVGKGGWTVLNGSGRSKVAWKIQNTEKEARPGFLVGMSGQYAISDSALDSRARIEETLITPTIDCRGFGEVRLQYSQIIQFNPWNDSSQFCDVEVNLFDEDTGRWSSDWVLIFRKERTSGDTAGLVELPIGSIADGKRIRVRWRFHEGKWDFFWAIDNIRITGLKEQNLNSPLIEALIINEQAASTGSRNVSVSSVAIGHPTHLMISESSDFSGSQWQPYTAHIRFTLSPDPGLKSIFLKVKNPIGVSDPLSAQIKYEPTGPPLKVSRQFKPARIFKTGVMEVALAVEYHGDEPPIRLSILENLPLGWIFDSVTEGPNPSHKPAMNHTGNIRFEWDSIPSFPFEFSYRVRFAGQDAFPQGEVQGEVGIHTASGTITEVIQGASVPMEPREDGMFHRVLYHGTVLTSKEWDWIAEAGFTLVHSYGGSPEFLLEMMDHAHRRGLKMIAGSAQGQEVQWMRFQLNKNSETAPENLWFDVRHHYTDPNPSLVFFTSQDHPLNLFQVNLEDPQWSTIGKLADQLNGLGLGLFVTVEAGKENMPTQFLATWQYGNLANGDIAVFGSELAGTYRHYVDTIKDHPALFCIVPFDDVDLTFFSPNFQRYVREKIREWAPNIQVYVLPRGDPPGTFQHDHKVAYGVFDGFITYIYPGVLPDHADVVRTLNQDWWAFQKHVDPLPWLFLGKGFSFSDAAGLPPRGSLIEQWEAVKRAEVPLTGFGFYAWQHGNFNLGTVRYMQQEAKEINRMIRDSHFDIRITQDVVRSESDCATAHLKATVTGGLAPVVLEWDFGDGQLGYGAEQSHEFCDAGVYEVSVRALDRRGLTASKSTRIYFPERFSPIWKEDFDDGQAQGFVDSGGDWTVERGSFVPVQQPVGMTWSFVDSDTSVAYSIKSNLIFQQPGGEAVIVWSGAATNADSKFTWSVPNEPEFTLKGTSLLELHTDAGVVKAYWPFDENHSYQIVIDVWPAIVVVSVDGIVVLEQGILRNHGDGVVGLGAHQTRVAWDEFTLSNLDSFQVEPLHLNPETNESPFLAEFTANPLGGVPPYSYQWDFGDGSTSNDANPIHEFPSPGAYQVQLRASDSKKRTAIGKQWIFIGARTLYREAEDYDWSDGDSPGYPVEAELGIHYGQGQQGRKEVDFYHLNPGPGDPIGYRDQDSVWLTTGTSDTGIHIRSTGAMDRWNYTFLFPNPGMARVRAFWNADNAPRVAAVRVTWQGGHVGDLVFKADSSGGFKQVELPPFAVNETLGQLQFHPLDWGLDFARFELDFVPGTDMDLDGLVDVWDWDLDGDGFLNSDEKRESQSDPNDPFSTPIDSDSDYTSDLNDLDDDNDGVRDVLDTAPLIANRSPFFIALEPQVVRANETLSLEFEAVDLDLPRQGLTYKLDGDIPTGATISVDGSFTWKPASDQAFKQYTVKVVATDDGTPPMSAIQNLLIRVNEELEEGFEPVTLETSQGKLTVVVPRKKYEFTASNRTLFLSTTGDDTNPGSMDAPWSTFVHAVSQLVAGDVLFVREGDYFEPFEIPSTVSGTKTQPVILSAYPGEKVRIRQPEGWQDSRPHGSTVSLQWCKYVWFHGFEVEGGLRPPRANQVWGYGRACLTLGGNGQGVRILNNSFYWGVDHGLNIGYNDGGWLVEGNVIWECSSPWSGSGISVGNGVAPAILRGNAIVNSGVGFGIDHYANGNLFSYNNLSIRSQTLGYIVRNSHGIYSSHNVMIRNGVAGLSIEGNSSLNTFLNSIYFENQPSNLYRNDFFGIYDGGELQNTLDSNLFDPNSDLASPMVWFTPWLGSHRIQADPKFVDPDGLDFRLQEDSPARNAATATPLLGTRPFADLGLFPATHYWQPDLRFVPDLEINEGETLIHQLELKEPNPPTNQIVFEFAAEPPAGAHLDSSTGLFTWKPHEIHGPGVYQITAISTADDSDFLTGLVTFNVTVREVNRPPMIGIPGDLMETAPSQFRDIRKLSAESVQGTTEVRTDGSIVIRSKGFSYDGRYENFHFSYSEVWGDFDVRVRMLTQPTRIESVMGLMMRADLTPESPMMKVHLQTGRLEDGTKATYSTQYRAAENEHFQHVFGNHLEIDFPNAWMRLKRDGNTATSYWSEDGNQWQEIHTQALSDGFSPFAYVGIATHWLNYSPDEATEFAFSDFRLKYSRIEPFESATVSSGEELTILFEAEDLDLPVQSLDMELESNAPEGAKLNAATGLFQWTPSHYQAGNRYTTEVVARDNGIPELSQTLAFVIDVTFGKALVSGQARYYGPDHPPISNVLGLINGFPEEGIQTNWEGNFNLTLTAGSPVRLSLSRPVDPLPSRGITTLDILLVRGQILNARPIDSPYGLIAADVNGSGSVTTLDILLMRRMILGLSQDFPAGLWKFVPSDFVFPKTATWWDFPVERIYAPLMEDHSSQDFIGIKLGDVNGSWTPLE